MRTTSLRLGRSLSQFLVQVPKSTAIPIFALGLEKGRSAAEQQIISEPEALLPAVNGNTARILRAGRYGAFQVVHRCCRLGQRTAIYSTWLAFAQAEPARAFLSDYPRLGLDAIERQTDATLIEHEARMRHGLDAGRFDLGHLNENARLKRAREYVTLCEEICVLRQNQLDTAALRQAFPDLNRNSAQFDDFSLNIN